MLCLTRVMMDDDPGIEMARIAAILERIRGSLGEVPPQQRDGLAKALLAYALKSQTVASTRAVRLGVSNEP